MQKKIINPCMCEVYGGKARAFVEIEYNDGSLSIYGVIGPMGNGEARGSCGQCVEEIRKGKPVKGWSQEMLNALCEIWDRWHLNDLRPFCKHQKALGWDVLAGERVTLYNYRLNHEAIKKKKEAEQAALTALRKGEIFRPTEEQAAYAMLPYSIKTYQVLPTEKLMIYEPKKPLSETKTLGWLRPEEHPDGILCKPCPVCGYKYGTLWKKEEVPKDVIDWLFSLPDTDVQPAWI